MKVQKRLNYHHNRHRSDGALIENQRKRFENNDELLSLSNKKEKNKFINHNKNKNNYYNSLNINKDNNNKYQNSLNLTEENIRNTSTKYMNDNNNSYYKNSLYSDNYLNIEYFRASDNLSKNLSNFYKTLKKPLPKFSKKEKRVNEFTDKRLEEENLLLAKENIQLEQEINLLQKNVNFYNNNINNIANNLNFDESLKNEIEKLYNINQIIIRENDYYRKIIDKIKINKEDEKMINNSLKYKTDFLVQNMVGSMKDLIQLFENDININTNINSNMNIENKSYSFIPTENFENYTQSSLYNENNQSKEQYSDFNYDLNNNINNFIYNDNSRNYKDREINFPSKY